MKDSAKEGKMQLVKSAKEEKGPEEMLRELMREIEESKGGIVEVEKAIWRGLLRIGLGLMKWWVKKQSEEEEKAEAEVNRKGEEVKYHSQRSRKYVTIFGEVEIERRYYWGEGKEGVCRLDGEMGLGEGQYGGKMEEWMVELSVVMTYEESVGWVERHFGVKIPKRVAENKSREVGEAVKEYYEEQAGEGKEEKARAKQERKAKAGECINLSLDGKGIGMRKEELAKSPTRRGRGEKAQQKKMAEVATIQTVKLTPRSGEARSEEGWPELESRDRQVFGELAAKEHFPEFIKVQLASRVAEGIPVVMTADGQVSLWKRKAEICPEAIEILDFFHACEYLWKAVYLIHPEGSPDALTWIGQAKGQLLAGQVGTLIEDLASWPTSREFTAAQTETVRKVTGYFEANRSRMRYDVYLQAGYPIGSGSVESACKQLVAVRMDGAGMRWSIPGAQAMLDLRSVHLNHDWPAFWAFYRRQLHQRLYGSSSSQPVTKMELAAAA